MADKESTSTKSKEREQASSSEPEQSEAEGMTWEELEPTPVAGATVVPGDPSLHDSGVIVLDPEVDDPSEHALDLSVPEKGEAEPLKADAVKTLQIVAVTSGAIVVINGASYSLDGNGVAALSNAARDAAGAVHW